MGAAIWSTTAQQMRDYPLVAFVRFFIHHGLLDLVDRPKWRTVSGGSTNYVQRLLGAIEDVRIGTGVRQIRREHGGVTVIDSNGQRSWFNDVVIATHADQALQLLADPDEAEASLLGAFGYTDNEAVLHSDTSLMPKRERVWSSWNYIGDSNDSGERPLCVTYWMNKLQNLDRKHPLFVTLNPTRDIARDKFIRSFSYSHPLFDRKAVEAQQHLWRLQGNRHTYFAGSYFGMASTRTRCNRASRRPRRWAGCAGPGGSRASPTASRWRRCWRPPNDLGALCGQGVSRAGPAAPAQARLSRLLAAARSR